MLPAGSSSLSSRSTTRLSAAISPSDDCTEPTSAVPLRSASKIGWPDTSPSSSTRLNRRPYTVLQAEQAERVGAAAVGAAEHQRAVEPAQVGDVDEVLVVGERLGHRERGLVGRQRRPGHPQRLVREQLVEHVRGVFDVAAGGRRRGASTGTPARR